MDNELQKRIEDLEKKVNNLNNPASLPDSFVQALIRRGFVFVAEEREYYTATGLGQTHLFVDTPKGRMVLGAEPAIQFRSFTADPSSNELTSFAHGMADDTRVFLYSTGGLPSPLSPTVFYYVISSTPNTFQLSTTIGGSEENITDIGSGLNYLAVV